MSAVYARQEKGMLYVVTSFLILTCIIGTQRDLSAKFQSLRVVYKKKHEDKVRSDLSDMAMVCRTSPFSLVLNPSNLIHLLVL